MKLKKEFILHETGGESVLVPVGKAEFSGLVRLNATAAFIVGLLQQESSFEQLLSAMQEKYEGDPARMRQGLEKTLNTLREVNALDE